MSQGIENSNSMTESLSQQPTPQGQEQVLSSVSQEQMQQQQLEQLKQLLEK
jgi:hypothetical protein